MKVRGGRATYGAVAGILMLDSASPRIPGDPGHAGTFPFPVRYAVARGVSVDDLVTFDAERVAPAVDAARELEAAGVRFVAADCGLFGLYQEHLAAALGVPFLGSALSLVPLLAATLAADTPVGIITGHTAYLREAHLAAANIDPVRAVIRGMEDCGEFRRVVLEGVQELDVGALGGGVRAAAAELVAEGAGALLLECTNLIPFRQDLQVAFGLPVFDLASLIDLYAGAYRLRAFSFPYAGTDGFVGVPLAAGGGPCVGEGTPAPGGPGTTWWAPSGEGGAGWV